MPRVIVATPRFVLREIEPDDADAMFALNADPEVVRYTGDAFASVDAARAFFGAYHEIYARDGFGRWAVVVDDEAVGFSGLRRQEDGEVDLGYRLARRLWGRGLATEIARACLDVGFARFGLSRIVARVHIDNAASIRVLAKIGMRRVGPCDLDGEPGVVYEVVSR